MKSPSKSWLGLFYFIGLAFIFSRSSWANGAGQSAGLILFDPASARAAATGEAFSAVKDDIAAFPYNPASLRHLSSAQTSFSYQRGLTDDARGRFLIGMPIDCGGVGFNLNYYDGGSFDKFSGGVKSRVDAKKDLVVGLGAARSIGHVAVGVAWKYISSEIVEQEKATAWAADLGIQVPVHPRTMIGASLQNLGGKLVYLQEREDLPRIFRLGASWQAIQGRTPLLVLAEAPYFFNEQEVRPAIGLETRVGPLALRAGYKGQDDLADFSFGAGFFINKFSIDYSFGLVEDLRDEHNVSVALKFGRGS